MLQRLSRLLIVKSIPKTSTFTRLNDASFLKSFGTEMISLLFPLKDIQVAWARVIIQLVPCQRVYDSSYASLLPSDLVKSLMSFHCQLLAPKSESMNFNIVQFLQQNDFTLFHTTFYDELSGKKMAFSHGTMSLNPKIFMTPSDICIFSNLSQNRENGFLELRYRMRFPAFRVTLPNNSISFCFPLSFLPQCNIESYGFL